MVSVAYASDGIFPQFELYLTLAVIGLMLSETLLPTDRIQATLSSRQLKLSKGWPEQWATSMGGI